MIKFFKNIAFKSLLYLNIGFAFFLLISGISPFVSPQKAWFFAFIGISYPYLLIANLIFVFFWLTSKTKRFILISLITILIGGNNLSNVFHFPGQNRRFQQSEETFKVLSYNVRAFNKYKWLKTEKAEKKISDFVLLNHADIICIQEFSLSGADTFLVDLSKSYKKYLNGGLAIFSKFEIVNEGNVILDKSKNVCIFSDMLINDDTVRVYNNHLQSIHFEKRDYDLIDSIQIKYNDDHMEGVKNIFFKMKDAYCKRAEQADIISKHINKSPYPVILCGDFNDTPISYTYHKMKAKLNDAYRVSGSGLGNTYVGKLPSFRIDFIFYDNLYKAYNYKRHRIVSSDHYPISCDFIKK